MGTVRRFFRGLRAEKAELWDVVPSGDLHAALALKPPKGGLDTRSRGAVRHSNESQGTN